MIEKVVFTIVAKNYIGLAEILGESVLKYDSDVKFFIFIADEKDSDIQLDNDRFNYIFANEDLEIPHSQFYSMAFKYNLTEFCTAIKPFCFEYIIDRFDNVKILYFDPDIITFSDLNYIWKKLDQKSIFLTPHILTPEITYSGRLKEKHILGSGTFNLGFLGLKKSDNTILMIQWWKNRLIEQSYADKYDALFTDQKWIDFAPSFFSDEILFISRNLGLNVAPWNFYERKIIKQKSNFYVQNRILSNSDKDNLVFCHFSGFDYNNLTFENKNIVENNVFEDYEPIFFIYKKLLSESKFNRFFNLSYSYSRFSNGDKILHFHRRLYRRLLEYDYELYSQSPFSVESAFFKLLKKNKMLCQDNTNIDKLNELSYKGFHWKLVVLNKLHRLLIYFIGAERYFVYAKFMTRYYRPENQTFLLLKKQMKKSFIK